MKCRDIVVTEVAVVVKSVTHDRAVMANTDDPECRLMSVVVFDTRHLTGRQNVRMIE